MKRRINSPPALVAKLHRVRGGWSPVDRYVTGKKGGYTIFTTLDGESPSERARQVRHLLALRPHLCHGLDHWILSLHPDLGELSDGRWRMLAKDWLKELGYGTDVATLAVRHRDTPHDHIHIIASRIRADGSAVSDGNSRWRGLNAAVTLAHKHDLGQLQPRVMLARRSHSVARAKRRATRRRGLSIDELALAAAVKAAVAGSRSLAELRTRLADAGIEARLAQGAGRLVSGWALRFRGVEEWVSGGALADGLTLPQVILQVRRQQIVDSPRGPEPFACTAFDQTCADEHGDESGLRREHGSRPRERQ